MIDGLWWLVIWFAVIAVLWSVAKRRGAQADKGQKQRSTAKVPNNDALHKTAKILAQHFTDYRVNRKENHLLVSKQHKKVAMITIDKTLAAGRRRLGDVAVLNYHRVPSRTQLTAHLSETE